MVGWSTVAALAILAGVVVWLYARGRSAGAHAARMKAHEARNSAQEAQDEKDREFEALDRDDDLTRRMRELRQHTPANNGDIQE